MGVGEATAEVPSKDAPEERIAKSKALHQEGRIARAAEEADMERLLLEWRAHFESSPVLLVVVDQGLRSLTTQALKRLQRLVPAETVLRIRVCCGPELASVANVESKVSTGFTNMGNFEIRLSSGTMARAHTSGAPKH